MTNDTGKTIMSEESCDIRVWSEECRHDISTTSGEKYLCAACGKIPGLDHEVRHEIFPYVSGDEDNLY